MAGLLGNTPSKSILDVGNTGPINFGAITGVDIPASNFNLINVKPAPPTFTTTPQMPNTALGQPAFSVNPIVNQNQNSTAKDVILGLALAIPQAFERFALSAGEAIPRTIAGAYALTGLPGSDIASKISTAVVPPAPVPGLGLLGDTQSYESKFNQGESFGKTAFDIATDEPIGFAFKPVLAGVGLVAKSFFGKGIEGAIEQQKQMISFMQEAATEHRAKSLLKYFGNKSPDDHSLDELLVQAMGTNKKSARLDDIVSEAGFRDMGEAQKALDDYRQLRKDLNDAQATLKGMTQKLREQKAKELNKPVEEIPEYTGPELQASDNIQFNVPRTLGLARMDASKILSEAGKMADSTLNVSNLNISSEGRDIVERVVEDIKPMIQEKLGRVLSNKEALKLAENTSDILTRAIGREETLEWQAKMLKARQALSAGGESGFIDKDYIDNLLAVKTQGADVARKLQSLGIGADAKDVTAKQTILDAVLDATQNADEILKAAQGVDFNDFRQATDFYRKFIRPTATDWLDLIRYNSMLSSPKTHIINAFSNVGTTLLVAPIERAIAGGLDFLGSKVTGGPRNMFAGESGPMLKGYFQNVGEATKRFFEVMQGKRAYTNLDTKHIPIAASGAKGALVTTLSYPMRLLEASDQFFTALTEGASTAALQYRAGKGVKVGNIETLAQKEAAYRLFRQELFDGNQGPLLDFFDQFSSMVQFLRNNKNPLVANLAKFTVPFLRTPMNILKQGVEFSPAGFATIPGAGNKTEQLAKAIMGSAVFGSAYMMLASNRLTWGEPTNATDKQNFRAAGMQPYSVKIGDKWYSYQKLPPALAFPLALTAAIDDTKKKGNIDDNTTEKVLQFVAKYGQFLADQSYAKQFGDLLNAAKNGEAGVEKVVSNYGQQLVPFRALGGWLARLFDSTQRKIDSSAPFIEQQVQLLMLNIPGLSQNVPPRLDSKGKPIPAQSPVGNAFSPVQFSQEQQGGSEEFQKIMQIQQINKKTTADKEKVADLATAEINKIDALDNPDEKKAYLKEVAASNPELAQKVIAELKERSQKSGLSVSELKLKNATVATRAEFIAQELTKMTTDEEKKAYLKDLTEKKILTTATLKELKKLQNK